MEIAIVAVIVIAAAGLLGLRLVRRLRAPAKGCVCPGCPAEGCEARREADGR